MLLNLLELFECCSNFSERYTETEAPSNEVEENTLSLLLPTGLLDDDDDEEVGALCLFLVKL